MHDFNDHGHGDRHWRKFQRFSQRMRGFPGMAGFPDWQGLEGNLRIGRMLASGDLRLVALYLIEQQPRHGYDLIKAIEEKTGGFYSPSPGIIYPALTFLEEAGYVTSSADGNKKAYAITDEGRAHLADNRQAVESTLDYLGKISRRWAEMREKFAEAGLTRCAAARAAAQAVPTETSPLSIPAVNDARRALKAAIAEAVRGSHVDQRKLADILQRAADEIRGLATPQRDTTASISSQPLD